MAGVDTARIERAVLEILLAIGEDPTRPGLERTPQRVAEAYAEFFGGLDVDPLSHLADTVPLGATEAGVPATSDAVVLRNLAFRSVCEHHLLPFVGTAHVAYLPAERVVGLGRIPAVIDTLAARPQLQERLAEEIADALEAGLQPKGVLVVLDAQHRLRDHARITTGAQLHRHDREPRCARRARRSRRDHRADRSRRTWLTGCQRWSWASSTSRPTRSATAAGGSTPTPRSRTGSTSSPTAPTCSTSAGSPRDRVRRGWSPRRSCAAWCPSSRELAARGIRVSVDTMRAATAAASVEAGAEIINDVSAGLADAAMAPIVAETGVHYVAMHWRGHSDRMDALAEYRDVATEVRDELAARVDALVAAGVVPERLILDPASGSPSAARRTGSCWPASTCSESSGCRILVGASRKRFLGALLPDDADVEERDLPTAVVSALSAQAGAWGVRVHDVRGTRRALDVLGAWQSGRRG